MRCRCLTLFALAFASFAQAQSLPTVNVRGTVIDAASATPISGAQLTLTGMTPSILPASNPSPVLNSSRVASTDSAGAYEIRGVAAGSYRLFVRRLGYQPALVELEVGDATRDTRLSFGLVVVPIRLERVQVDGERMNTFGRLLPPNEGDDSLPVIAVRARQREFLSTDVRDLTALGALQDGATGETDILRALRRFPGVTGKDDHSAELWVRGARWDQVRMSYDGLPIFNPFHASETATSISGDAIGAAFLHPGVRPVSLLSQGASLVDIRSRSATDTGSKWIAGASRRDLGAGYESTSRDGKSGWVVTGRRSFRQVVGLPIGLPIDHDDVGEYSELTVRADRRLNGDKSLEFSALRTEDKALVSAFPIFGETQGQMPVSSRGMLYRLTLRQSVGRLLLSHTAGVSDYRALDASSRYPLGVADTTTYFVTRQNYSHGSSVNYMTVRGDVRPANSSRWNAGYEYYRFHTSSHALQHDVSWSNLSQDHFNLRRSRVVGAVWSEGRWNPLSALSVDAGVRLESPNDAFRPRLAPSAQGRFRLDAVTHLSVGASRTFQDAQEIPFTSNSSSATRGFWFLSGSGFPTERSDQVSAGIDRWLGGSLLIDVNAYTRRMNDVAVRPLPSGDTLPRPLVLSSQVAAKGIEFGLRKLAGPFTGGLGYTLARSTERIDGTTYDGSGDRRHEIDATAMWRGGNYRLGSAFTFMTGAPFTRAVTGRGYYVAADSVEWHELANADTRNGRRLPDFASLDFFVERTGRVHGKAVTTYMGVQNALNRFNFTENRIRSLVASSVQEQPDNLVERRGRHLNLGLRIVF